MSSRILQHAVARKPNRQEIIGKRCHIVAHGNRCRRFTGRKAAQDPDPIEPFGGFGLASSNEGEFPTLPSK